MSAACRRPGLSAKYSSNVLDCIQLLGVSGFADELCWILRPRGEQVWYHLTKLKDKDIQDG
eukprot:6694426-Pyramimonas_sp.AAC.1